MITCDLNVFLNKIDCKCGEVCFNPMFFLFTYSTLFLIHIYITSNHSTINMKRKTIE